MPEKNKSYRIPVSWQMYGYITVEAETLEEAIEQAEDTNTPLPEGSYVQGSFEVDRAAIDEDSLPQP